MDYHQFVLRDCCLNIMHPTLQSWSVCPALCQFFLEYFEFITPQSYAVAGI